MKFFTLAAALLALFTTGNAQTTSPNPFNFGNGKPIFVVMHPNMFEQLGLPKFNSAPSVAAVPTPIVPATPVHQAPTIVPTVVPSSAPVQSKLALSQVKPKQVHDADFDEAKFQPRLSQNEVLKPIQHVHNKNDKSH